VDYFAAVQEGRRRVNQAVAALQEVAGPCHPVLFLKLGSSDWTPVGEEMFHKSIPGKGGTAALVICDADGNSKAMSGWFPVHKTGEFSETLTQRGIPVFAGDVSLPI
jgi:hypothetical protein